MYRRFFVGCLLVASFAMVHVFAESRFGKAYYGNESVDAIDMSGNLSLDGTKVTKRLEVDGRLEANGAEIGELRVHGLAVLDGCVVRKQSTVYGRLEATKTTFEEELSVASEHVVFSESSLQSLRMLQTGHKQTVPLVELRGKTKVNGSIVFEGGKGEVIVGSGSEVVGEIVGGTVRK